MPEEETSLQIKTIAWLFFVIFLVAIVIALVFSMTFPFNPVANAQQGARAAVEISENIFVSPLTTAKAAFSPAELDRIDGGSAEPYATHCNFGYRAEIESEGRKWSWGFEPNRNNVQRHHLGFLNEFSILFPVTVERKPGTMKLFIYESTLTRVQCLAMRAQLTKKVESIFCRTPKQSYASNVEKFVTCFFQLEQNGDELCMLTMARFGNYRECRHYEGVPVEKYRFYGDLDETEKEMVISAYPLKKGAAFTDCSSIGDGMVAHEDDDVERIVFCLGGGAK